MLFDTEIDNFLRFKDTDTIDLLQNSNNKVVPFISTI